jgi:hypothetical protein
MTASVYEGVGVDNRLQVNIRIVNDKKTLLPVLG